MDSEELRILMTSGEADRVEMTRSTRDTNKFREAICSFSNDMSGRELPGYLLIGVDEEDADFRLPVTDELMQQFASYRSDGQVMPLPVLNVEKVPHPDGNGEILVVEVKPHDMPPIRFRGRVHIRVGPRKDTASETEERVLMERRTANFPTYDVTPCPEGELARLDLETFRQTYRRSAVAEEVIAENHRDLKEQLGALPDSTIWVVTARPTGGCWCWPLIHWTFFPVPGCSLFSSMGLSSGMRFLPRKPSPGI